MQAAIFNYDITREFVALWQHEPQGFALNVSLKDLVHKLYEYDKALTGRLVGRLLSLAAARGVAIQAADLREERKRWKAQLSRLGKWSEVRNSATGHYSSDISKQVRLLKQLNRGEIVDVAAAVLTYNGAILWDGDTPFCSDLVLSKMRTDGLKVIGIFIVADQALQLFASASKDERPHRHRLHGFGPSVEPSLPCLPSVDSPIRTAPCGKVCGKVSGKAGGKKVSTGAGLAVLRGKTVPGK